jgi:hypothetical protein
VEAGAFQINMLPVSTNRDVIPREGLFGRRPPLTRLVTVGAVVVDIDCGNLEDTV